MGRAAVWVGDGDPGVVIGALRTLADDEFRMLLDDIMTMFAAVERSHTAQEAIAAAVRAVITPPLVRSLVDAGALTELASVISVAEELRASREHEGGLLGVAAALDRLAVLVQANDSLQQRLQHLEHALVGQAAGSIGMLPIVHLRECAELADDVCSAIRDAGHELDDAYLRAIATTVLNVDRLRDAIHDSGLGSHASLAAAEALLDDAEDSVVAPLRQASVRSPSRGLTDAIGAIATALRALAAELENLTSSDADPDLLEVLRDSYTTVEERKTHADWVGATLPRALERVGFEDSVHVAEWLDGRDEGDL